MNRNKNGQFKKGEPSSRKNIILSEDIKNKISKSCKGRIPWNKGKKNVQPVWNNGINHPYYGKFGSESANWKGGLTPLNILVRESEKYSMWRTNIYKRDGYICQECFQEGYELEVHHIEKFSHIMRKNKITTFEAAMSCEKLWDLNNGKTLCKKCHKKLHRARKYNINEMMDLI